MKILSALPALALLLCLASCGPSDSRAATLRLKAKPGDSYVLQYKTDTVLDRAASAEGPATTENSTLLLVRRYTCTGEKGTSTKWTVKTESAKASGLLSTLPFELAQCANARLGSVGPGTDEK